MISDISHLHHIESRLNGRVANFLLREGLDRYDPERFLDYKQNCVLAMLECLKTYDPDKGAEFLTYAHHFIGNALLDCRMKEESGSFSSLDEYKNVRGIAWLYNQSGNGKKAAAQYAEQGDVLRKRLSSIRPWRGLTEVRFRSMPPCRTRTRRKPARM